MHGEHISTNQLLHLDKLEQMFYINGIAFSYMFSGPSPHRKTIGGFCEPFDAHQF